MVVISVDPDAGELFPGDSTGPQLRQYADEVESVRVLYWVTALRTVVVVAFIEVDVLDQADRVLLTRCAGSVQIVPRPRRGGTPVRFTSESEVFLVPPELNE